MSTAITKAQNKSAKRGQGMTEYIIIVALIAIATVGVVTVFGNNIRSLFGMSADVLAGTEPMDQRRAGQMVQQQKNIQNFKNDNVAF